MIIVGMGAWIGSIYQARALLAMMTAQARQTPIFREYKVQTVFTFFDLANMLGFERITVTDGKSFAHGREKARQALKEDAKLVERVRKAMGAQPSSAKQAQAQAAA